MKGAPKKKTAYVAKQPVGILAIVSAGLAGLAKPPGVLTDVGAGGTLTVSWPPVEGATGAEVTTCSAVLTPATVDDDLGTISPSSDGKSRVLTLPKQRAVRRLVLNGMKSKNPDGSVMRDFASGGVLDASHRLVVGVATGDGSFGPPLYAVPQIDAVNLQPALLAGASVTSGSASAPATMRLPDVPATRIRLSVVSGGAPESFVPYDVDLGAVGVVAAAYPADLAIKGPDGATVWAMPGQVPASSPPLVADLRVAAEAALTAAVESGKAPSVAFAISGAPKSHVYLAGPTVKGALLRSFPGVATTTVAGEPAVLDGVGRLAAEVPSSARADLTVRYEGLRLLPAPFTDPVPAPRASVGGPIVSAAGAPVCRAFPPAGFGAHPLARVGLVGRAAEDASLSVTVVAYDGGEAGEPLGAPGIVDVAAGSVLDVVWVDLPSPVPSPETPVALCVRATAGTFLWAASAEGRPLARLAVRDENPAAAALTLAGRTLCQVGKDGLHRPGESLPAVAFAGPAPVLDCPLFVGVDVSDLVLRYAR